MAVLGAVGLVMPVLFGTSAHAASTKGPRSGNQCKKREVGQTAAGGLVCSKEGARYYWRRVTTGPQPANACDPNYSPCVPIASDVDCAGGSGNGPAYVRGPIEVIGIDVYGLDSDGDRFGCEN